MTHKQSWFKPHILNPKNIERVVEAGKPGVYMLANVGEGRKYKVQAIHTSQSVREELLKNLGKFQLFMYKPLKHQLQAFSQTQQTLQFV